MQWRKKKGEKGKEQRLDNNLDPNLEPGTNGFMLPLSFCCQQIVQEKCDRYWFFCLKKTGGRGEGYFSDSCHPAPPTCCSQHLLWNHQNPFLPPMGWADCAHPCGQTHSVRHVHHLPQCSRSFVLSEETLEIPLRSRDWLSWPTNSSSALQISRGIFRYKDVALTVELHQRSCCCPSPFPHPVYVYGHPFLVLNNLSWIIK